MKKLLVTTALAAGLAVPAAAQNAEMSPFQGEAAGPSVSASDVIGARIYASEAAIEADAYAGVQDGWNDIGEVNDIILGRDGSVDAVLVDIGGFLGVGERQVAVDMAALRFVQDDATDADDWFLVMQADRATLDGAPEWTLMNDRAASSTDGMENIPVVNEATGASEDKAAADMAADTQMAETAVKLPEGYTSVASDALTTEMLTGANVHDAADASIAEVSDLVITAEGQITHVVLDVGGFLGIGTRTVALPIEDLTIAQSGESVRLWVRMTKQELEALPEHTM